MLVHAGLPLQFWEDAVRTALYIRFRLPTKTLPNNKTPYEMVHHKVPNLSHLRVWGCQCWIQVSEDIRLKFGDKMLEGIFIGYEDNRIGWRVRDTKGKDHF
ncbi:copia protein, partial [Lentinula edodes]